MRRIALLTIVAVLLLQCHSAASFAPHRRNAFACQYRSPVLQMNKIPNELKDMLEGQDPDNVVMADEDLTPEMLEELQANQPSQWSIMKELLGIGTFTYALGAMTVLFLALNFFLGPGWLGSAIGLGGAEIVTDGTDPLPKALDLTNPDFLI
uniref:Uncharacterized protein n=1 Tax=Craspedostauros australis TaxID=1486917 RepID=A0A7R9ZS67_9STRA|mmetsp:Transcript_8118/g.21999  ORF Transcript_8118/g.21999 Transcript_8118/m.21999 type:complete len:152 (+) Transcript_8118:271-726(+)|eukprot:CAMPEP_0198115474 /NCGR_PEP_ID=MMETSP1442-20131203/6569_1 /TAXON_ID= /ORGANISM="Craspedostauros australis, Strain CCMP3328" /LENGTH=151 /DNA_ID=CAMNT_0043772989 /DNA_START=173 /DNA_END=628 /DNA_ORIENTATION=-